MQPMLSLLGMLACVLDFLLTASSEMYAVSSTMQIEDSYIGFGTLPSSCAEFSRVDMAHRMVSS